MESLISHPPYHYDALLERTREINFSMASDMLTGSLLRTLATSKPGGRILELGTGTGLSLSWITSGMDEQALVTSLDNDPELITIASQLFKTDNRVQLICQDGFDWLKNYSGPSFDLIFADTWPGKFYLLKETLDFLNPGSFYLIDNLLPETDWPEGHGEKVNLLIKELEALKCLQIAKINWSTGLILAAKKTNNNR